MTIQFVLQGTQLMLKGLNHDNVAVEATDKQFISSFMRKQAWLLQVVAIEDIEKMRVAV